MKKSLTLIALVFGMLAFTQICRAESTSLNKTESAFAKRSFSFFTFTAQLEAAATAHVFQLDLQKSADATYLFTLRYSIEIIETANNIFRLLFIVYIAWLFKKNLPLLIQQPA